MTQQSFNMAFIQKDLKFMSTQNLYMDVYSSFIHDC